MTRKEFFPLKTLLAVSLAAGLMACSENAEQPADIGMAADSDEPTMEAPLTVVDANPFFSEWGTPYGIPPFAEIHDEHYKPAFERGIEQQRADIAAIRDNPEDPTFENTIEALELAGASLDVVKRVFKNITNTDTNEVLQELEVEIPSLHSTLQAQIEELVPAADPGSRSFMVKARIEFDDRLLPGMYARLLVPAGRESLVLVPADRVTEYGQLDMVWVQSNGHTDRRFIRAGREVLPGMLEVVSGLEEGELVVLPQ